MNTRRKGKICISDAKIRVNDDTGDFKNGFDAEPILKAKIALRLVAYLKSQGWAFHVPYDDYAWLEENSSSRGVKKKGRSKFAEKHRKGIKDGLEVEISANGVGVDIEFWENVVDHTADNSHGGRHIFDKESKMPYRQLCRLRATKLKIINFLTKYHDYILMDNAHPLFPQRHTGLDLVQKHYDESWHHDGSDIWDKSLQRICEYNARSADGNQIEHGSMVWTRDYKNRWVYGRAMYNINNMWWILSGKWDRYNKANFEIYTSKPADLNVRVSRERATRSLESKIKSAVDKKDFLLAHRLQTAFNKQFGESGAA
ncbi:hypothetical protein PL84_03535 [Vibrio anguillarum]|uniref:hypothetical protein n=1 Tax=Vibrio anguillarum TaxID=55601 RepID=UPI00097E2005|nr:hypothetical protein [Vibrio anguillarum]MBT2909653.1 hypothetical protein [Vibrio anguillarum]MBT2942496.1 hypothetical protein [Vibrio anguillarum]MBT2950680.1 hypothetical protein [Vibrio anguillarum]MBT2979421.1 hypothetical protein [Vibrio anguillarum]